MTGRKQAVEVPAPQPVGEVDGVHDHLPAAVLVGAFPGQTLVGEAVAGVTAGRGGQVMGIVAPQSRAVAGEMGVLAGQFRGASRV